MVSSSGGRSRKDRLNLSGILPVTIQQVNERQKCRPLALFAILAAVLSVFYILIVVQIALGLYSLWDGFGWFRMVRRRLRTHAGFYTPLAAVICPCKGVEPGLKENLAALAQFDYPNYEIYFAISSERDPAVKIAAEVKDASVKPVHIVFAGPPEGCSGKVQNLRKAVESLPENIEILVFVDSDARLSRGWLKRLIAPLQDTGLGATTAYRWIIPSRSIGSGGF
jgi:cellulose synthase/poly-beta-1,6-N-acetylglucosamine synthase-like glycosyltransferase